MKEDKKDKIKKEMKSDQGEKERMKERKEKKRRHSKDFFLTFISLWEGRKTPRSNMMEM